MEKIQLLEMPKKVERIEKNSLASPSLLPSNLYVLRSGKKIKDGSALKACKAKIIISRSMCLNILSCKILLEKKSSESNQVWKSS